MQTLEKELAKLEKISFPSIKVGDVVGKGRFKRVHQGQFRGRDVVVLRYAKDLSRGFSPKRKGNSSDRPAEEEKGKNVNELRILASLAKKGDGYVPEIYGVCHEPHSTIIVQEFASWGTLKGLLQSSALKSLVVTNLHKLTSGQQISGAMGFLESQRVIHADLSCRNVLIFRFDEIPELTVAKVSDFGLSVLLEKGQDSVILKQPQATRWCAPETVLEGRLSHRADMWSFGCTMWEVYANGVAPWPNRPKRAAVAARLKDIAETGGASEGGSDVAADFPRAPDCPQAVHSRVLTCFKADEQVRPTFEKMTEYLRLIIEKGGEVDPSAFTDSDSKAASVGNSTSASRSRSPERRSRDFALPERGCSPEPDSPEWRAWRRLAEFDVNVAARLEVLLGFDEADRQVLLEAEGRIQRQQSQIAEMKQQASLKKIRKSTYPKYGESILSFASRTPSLSPPLTQRTPSRSLSPASFVSLASPAVTPRKRAVASAPPSRPPLQHSPAVRIETVSETSLGGSWKLWCANGVDVHRSEFQNESDALQAFKNAKALGNACALWDRSNNVLASTGLQTPCVDFDGAVPRNIWPAPARSADRLLSSTPPRRAFSSQQQLHGRSAEYLASIASSQAALVNAAQMQAASVNVTPPKVALRHLRVSSAGESSASACLPPGPGQVSTLNEARRRWAGDPSH